MQTVSNSIQVSHLLLQKTVKNASVIIDATCGNGNDTLFLAQNAPFAHIYAFDIQHTAIENTIAKTKEYENRINYICDSHINIKKYINNTFINAATFNLGYLPSGSHSITTDATTTINTVDCIKNLLAPNGVISILMYPGHNAGAKEYKQLFEHTRTFDNHIFTVGWYCLHNHTNAPALCWIEKQG
ncbi:class I SAM-dependent methyltransferase [Pectinatus sottacetonis]|uniref:class I SAM-dependent methyltransferase n=1 Tax=Pectinatus sottacetonis TaxID=1002795 RepID=UPI0018C452ED|nr:class I SAM-dependent methyltransferase [Pectinatus sottacetonis]